MLAILTLLKTYWKPFLCLGMLLIAFMAGFQICSWRDHAAIERALESQIVATHDAQEKANVDSGATQAKIDQLRSTGFILKEQLDVKKQDCPLSSDTVLVLKSAADAARRANQ